jgi:tetraacyldisaccharide-1-P 4'-kinase
MIMGSSLENYLIDASQYEKALSKKHAGAIFFIVDDFMQQNYLFGNFNYSLTKISSVDRGNPA